METTHTVLSSVQNRVLHGASLLVTARVNPSLVRAGWRREGTNAGRSAILGRLHGHGLAHDGAAVRIQLQLGHGAAAGRGSRAGAGGRRHGPQSGGRGRLEERAHGLGLTQDAVHSGRGSISPVW